MWCATLRSASLTASVLESTGSRESRCESTANTWCLFFAEKNTPFVSFVPANLIRPKSPVWDNCAFHLIQMWATAIDLQEPVTYNGRPYWTRCLMDCNSPIVTVLGFWALAMAWWSKPRAKYGRSRRAISCINLNEATVSWISRVDTTKEGTDCCLDLVHHRRSLTSFP